MNEMKRIKDMCQAASPLDPHRLDRARTRLYSAMAESQRRAGRPARRPHGLRAWAKSGRRPGWVVPLAAAGAVTAVIAGAATVSSTVDHPGQTPAATGEIGRAHV